MIPMKILTETGQNMNAPVAYGYYRYPIPRSKVPRP